MVGAPIFHSMALLHRSLFVYNNEVPIASCTICEKSFYVKPSHQKRGWGKYCSKACQTKSQFLGKIVNCFICGKESYRSQAQIKHSMSGKSFCSKSCQTKWRNTYFSEEKHPNWLGGESSYRDILMRTDRKKICVVCGLEDTRVLVVHHLDHNRKNNLLKNLVWVCLNCHFIIHHDHDAEMKIRHISND